MTALDELLVRITAALDECDASALPPLPTEPPCCDRHTEGCEVPDECCPACPEAVALAAFVAKHQAEQRAAAEHVTAELAEQITDVVNRHRSWMARWLLGENRRRRP